MTMVVLFILFIATCLGIGKASDQQIETGREKSTPMNEEVQCVNLS